MNWGDRNPKRRCHARCRPTQRQCVLAALTTMMHRCGVRSGFDSHLRIETWQRLQEVKEGLDLQVAGTEYDRNIEGGRSERNIRQAKAAGCMFCFASKETRSLSQQPADFIGYALIRANFRSIISCMCPHDVKLKPWIHNGGKLNQK